MKDPRCPICYQTSLKCSHDWEQIEAKEGELNKKQDWERFKLRAQIASEQLAALRIYYGARDRTVDEGDLQETAVAEADLLLAELEKEKV